MKKDVWLFWILLYIRSFWLFWRQSDCLAGAICVGFRVFYKIWPGGSKHVETHFRYLFGDHYHPTVVSNKRLSGGSSTATWESKPEAPIFWGEVTIAQFCLRVFFFWLCVGKGSTQTTVVVKGKSETQTCSPLTLGFPFWLTHSHMNAIGVVLGLVGECWIWEGCS